MSALVTLPDRALTLWQPWAWLVAAGHKPIENRPRGFSHKSFRGDFWIHAGKRSTAADESWVDVLRLCIEFLGEEFYLPNQNTLTFGAIIGRATITGIIPPRYDDIFGNPAPIVPWHFPDQYGFRVENARLLKKPVPCRGHQGFWRVPGPVLAGLKEAA